MKTLVLPFAIAGILAFTSVSITACASPSEASQSAVSVSSADFERLEGDGWTGTLSYLDYSTKSDSSIPVELSIEPVKGNKVVYAVRFPREAQYNARESINISRDGTRLDGAPIIERREMPDGTLKIVTLERGKDDNRSGDIRMTYLVGTSTFEFSKDVKFDDEKEFLERNTYRFAR